MDWKHISRWAVRRRWTVVAISFLLLILVFAPLRSVLRYYPSISWISHNARLTSHITVRQREALNAKVLEIVPDLPPPAFHPWCPTVMDMKLRYTDFYAYNSGNPSTIYLAVRIQKPETYLSSFIHELSTLILYVGSHRFYVHVVFTENTPSALARSFGRSLDVLRIAYKPFYEITFERSQFVSQGYVHQRTNQKNLAMEPFYTGIAIRQLGISSFDYIVLIEDSVFCAGDVLELLYEHKFQGAELTCALEWRGGLLHDKWTIRTNGGKPPYMRSELETFFNQTKDTGAVALPQPFFADAATRKRYRFLRSFPLFSCWSSIVVLDPRVFLPVPAVEGNVDVVKDEEKDHEKTGLRFRAAGSGHDSNRYSDTFVFCVDMWERSMYKILMVPAASIGDTFEMYDLVRQDGRRRMKHPVGLEREGRGLISYFRWPMAPPSEMVYHDYGKWQQYERVGKWDDPLSPPKD